MRIKCRCGNEDVILLPFDDTSVTTIKCTRACQIARQLKAEMAIKPFSGKLSSVFPNVHLGLPKLGMLGH